MSGRDYHSTHHENGAFRFEPRRHGQSLIFQPYDGASAVTFASDGEYRHAPEWYRQFLYEEEQARGLDAIEDLASPGELTWQLTGPTAGAVWVLRAGTHDRPGEASVEDVRARAESLRQSERARRAAFSTELDRSADAYIVKRDTGHTIVAGYPWFTDWGRDTFIAIRGLCLATGRLDDAKNILIEWAGAVSDGMLPNRFPDSGDAPEFNSVDASLWYIVAVHEFLELASERLTAAERERLELAIDAIVSGYARGTRFGIRMDEDGLLAAGIPGAQLTWMDARVGDWVVTPRIGKPVEVQALWLNALAIASVRDPRWQSPLERGLRSFTERFWDDRRGHLADVVDVDHVAGSVDETFRPNQVLAIGGLPLALVDGTRARHVVDAVEQRLMTPLGLRSLAPGSPGYAARYEGNASARDAVYHQGTVWPWLIGPFVEAWLRVRKPTGAARREARRRFVQPLLEHLEEAGLGHVSEIADADAPFTPRGCPFQAWSLGELLRLERLVLVRSARSVRLMEYAT
jgi:predicted glycogen debranching enzyme